MLRHPARLDCLVDADPSVRHDRFKKRTIIPLCGDFVNNAKACLLLLLALYICISSVVQDVKVVELRSILMSLLGKDFSHTDNSANRTETPK